MLGPLAFIFAWMLYLTAIGLVVVVSGLASLIPAARQAAAGIRAGALRSVLSLAMVQVLAFPLVLAAATALSIGLTLLASGRLDLDPPVWSAPLFILLVLGTPLAFSLLGIYLGFRAGWERAHGRETDALLQSDPILRRIGNIGGPNPVRWYLLTW
jgi:hypothetical protein